MLDDSGPEPSLTHQDPERTIEFEFVRATENAALQAIHWLGRGEKETADAAAVDAIRGVLDRVDICGEVAIGEGIKDNAPGLFLGDRLGTWKAGAPHFDVAVDPIDGTTNLANGSPNAISVIAASQRREGWAPAMRHLPSFYSMKVAFGPEVIKATAGGAEPVRLDDPLEATLHRVADALGKRVQDLVVAMLNRPRHAEMIACVRRAGAALRLASDGDVNLAVAPSLPDSGVDLFISIGGSPEGVLAAAALKALGGEMLLRMWPRDQAEKQALLESVDESALTRVYTVADLVSGDSALFCATGISDSALVPGVRLVAKKTITHSILMRARSRTVRYIRAVHDLESKVIHLGRRG
ncbi:MAG: class II fructose-bisphosphatase [Vicinamibacterales bacterium]